jgi:hypothetical protein
VNPSSGAIETITGAVIEPTWVETEEGVMSPQTQAGYLSQRVLLPATRFLKTEFELE